MQKLSKNSPKNPQKSFININKNLMKQQAKTFTGYINGFHLGGLEMIPDFIMGKNFKDFNPDEWISFICLLHTKAIKQEKEIKTLKSKIKALTKN